MAMPNGETFWGNSLTEAITNGSVPMSRLDDMATR
jgi:beta-glucosidase